MCSKISANEFFRYTAETVQPQELLDGVVVDQAAPSIRHQDITGGLFAELHRFVRQNGGRCRPFAAPTD